MEHTAVVQSLVDQINNEPGWKHAFIQAASDAIEQAPTYMEKYRIKKLDDYFNYMDALQTWIPRENSTASQLLEKILVFYHFFNQPSIKCLQTPIDPETSNGPLSWLSKWLIRYTTTLGEFLDTSESLTDETLATFYARSEYKLDDYIIPDGGWKSFNHFFTRRVKPDRRPISAPEDPTVIVSPTDCTLRGRWPIDENSIVSFKGISWSIIDLLQESIYGSFFHGGFFSHAILLPYDYHRIHSPVAGKVIESKVIPGQVMCSVTLKEGLGGTTNGGQGFQWCQMRGLIVLDSPMIGKVAVLPIGMGHVSSVIMTRHVGETIAKGDEIGYFAYGGSDVVMIFGGSTNIAIPPTDDQNHPDGRYFMGEKIGEARLLN